MPENNDEQLNLENISAEAFTKSLSDEAKELASKEEDEIYSSYEEKIGHEIAAVIKQDREERQRYADRLFKLIRYWLIAIIILVALSGLDISKVYIDNRDWNDPKRTFIERINIQPQFNLSDAVILALVGGTTVNIIGLFLVVTQYLFKPDLEKYLSNNQNKSPEK